MMHFHCPTIVFLKIFLLFNTGLDFRKGLTARQIVMPIDLRSTPGLPE